MFDFAPIDRMFEMKKNGAAISLPCTFDERTRIPLDAIAGLVASQLEVEVDEAHVLELVRTLWSDIRDGEDGRLGEGAPLHAVLRVCRALRLEATGWNEAEIRQLADQEQSFVDNTLADEEFAYIDDDLDLVIRFTAARVALFTEDEKNENTSVGERKQLANEASFLGQLKEIRERGDWKAGVPEPIARMAFRARAWDEMVRGMVFETEFGRVEKGFSPFVRFTRESWSSKDGFSGEGIRWKATLASGWCRSLDDRIRLPGLLLERGTVTLLDAVSPSAYERIWTTYDLDGYFGARRELRGERRCGHCHVPIDDQRRVFCSERCRGAAKQKRYRERNPASVSETQRRYWSSLDPLDKKR